MKTRTREIAGHDPESGQLSSRRAFIAAGSALSLGAGILALATSESAQGQENKGESLLDKWVREKKAVIGIDLTNAPLRFRDSSGKPTGMGVELLELLLKDIGAEPVYVEMPFGQMFAALSAGKFEMMGNFATILPGRSLRGAFAGFPAHYQHNVAYLKEGSKLTHVSELDAAGITIAAMQGTSEDSMTRFIFPKATIQAFPQITDAINAVGTGRVDALVTDALSGPSIFKTFPKVTVIPESVNAISNSFFMPPTDFKLWTFVTNWLRYQACNRLMLGLYYKWFGTEMRDKYKIPIVTVGSGGEPLTVSAT